MLKTFTLNERVDHQVSDTEGTVTFSITDELGVSRVISGKTFLNEKHVPQGVSSENKRELPLIEALFRLEINESVEVEFEHYNKLYFRDVDKTINQIAYEKALEMEKEQRLFYRIFKFFKRPKNVDDRQAPA